MFKGLGILLTYFFVRWLFGIGKEHDAATTSEGLVFGYPKVVILVILASAFGLTLFGGYLAFVDENYWFAAFIAILDVALLLSFPGVIVITATDIRRRRYGRTVTIAWSEIRCLVYRRGPSTYTVKSDSGQSIIHSPLHVGGPKFRAYTEERTGLRYVERGL